MRNEKCQIPRGIRNNNPLNLRVGNNWKGEVSQPTDHTFEQFTEMKWVVRTGYRLAIQKKKVIRLDFCEKMIIFAKN
jgi:hypothetical protein